jgi:hypothetical protein
MVRESVSFACLLRAPLASLGKRGGVLQQAFTSTIARGLSLVALSSLDLLSPSVRRLKRVLAGVLFGGGMAIAAVNFMVWLFP